MKITKAWIKKWEPCEEAVEWLEEQDTRDVFELIEKLRKSEIEDKYDWLFWALPKLMKTKKDRVRFAVFCAELALPIFEKEYPDDKRPRKAIQSAKNWLKNPTKKNREAAWAAVRAARAARAAGAAWAVGEAARAAAWVAAGEAVWDVGETTRAAWAAVGAVRAARAAGAVGEAVRADAGEKVINQIIDYGVKLLEGGE